MELFEAADLTVERSSSVAYRASIDDPRIGDVRILRAQEIPVYVAEGLFDIGITGRDWIEETASSVVTLGELRYSKATTEPIKLVLAVAEDSTVTSVKELPPAGVSTEYPELTRALLRQSRHRRRRAPELRRQRGQGARHRRLRGGDQRDRTGTARRRSAHRRHHPGQLHRSHRQPRGAQRPRQAPRHGPADDAAQRRPRRCVARRCSNSTSPPTATTPCSPCFRRRRRRRCPSSPGERASPSRAWSTSARSTC